MKTTTNTFKSISLCVAAAVALSACSRSDDPVIPETPPSDGTTLTLEGGEGGSAAENSVYVDLSAEQQTSVKRASWNLGFYNGSEFRVILNGATGSSAVDAETTDMAAVTSETFDISTLASGFEPAKMSLYDDTAGRIEHTVIAEIAANEEENNVYVVNTAFGSEVALENVWKVRILRDNADGYMLQYAPLNDVEFSTLTVVKNAEYNFKHISFANGSVDVEPKKANWDFMWGYHIYYTSMGPSVYIPYAFSDLVFINYLAGVSAAEVIFEDENGTSTGEPTYEDFAEADLSGVSFSNERNVIGSTWRVTPSPTPGIVVGTKKDRFYLIKDASGNIYKLRFNSFTSEDGGTRGYPELEYTLVKQG